MRRFSYGCEVVCNDNQIYPAMKQLVEIEGMGVNEAGRFIENDSDGQVTWKRAVRVYQHRTPDPFGSPQSTPQDDSELVELEKLEKPSHTHGGKRKGAGRKRRVRIQKLSFENTISDDFRQKFNAFLGAVKDAKRSKWITTSKKAVMDHIDILYEVVQL